MDGKFQTDEEFIKSLMKILYDGVIYNSIEELPANIDSSNRESIERSYNRVVGIWVKEAERFHTQHTLKPVQIVKFDLNEFLNVSERLRASQTFYVEG